MLTSFVLFSSLALLVLTSTTTASLLRGHKASVDELVDASEVDDVTEALAEEVGDRLLKKNRNKKDKGKGKGKGKGKTAGTAATAESTKGSGKGKDDGKGNDDAKGKGKDDAKGKGKGGGGKVNALANVDEDGNFIFDPLTPEEEEASDEASAEIGPVEGPPGPLENLAPCQTSRACKSLCCLIFRDDRTVCSDLVNKYTRCVH